MRRIVITLLAFVMSSIAMAQKKPTIMILPSDHWCEMRYFMTTYDNQGTKVKTPNYQQAFMEDTEIGPVISKIGQILTGMGYSLKDAEQEIKSINTKTAEDNVTMRACVALRHVSAFFYAYFGTVCPKPITRCRSPPELHSDQSPNTI